MRSAPSVEAVLPSEERAGRCLGCGYPLIGLPEPRCPECGREFDPNHLAPVDIPWLERREIGNFAAYLKTVFRVVVVPARFACQVHRTGHVKRREAEAFRRVTVAVSTGSAVATAAFPLLVQWGLGSVPVMLAVLAGCALLLAPVALFFWIATLRIEMLPNDMGFGDEIRFVRMQMFASAGLGLAPIVPLVTWGWAAMVVTGVIPLATGPGFVATSASAVVLTAWLGGEFTFHLRGGRFGAFQMLWLMFTRLALIAAAGVAGFLTFMLMGWLAFALIPS